MKVYDVIEKLEKELSAQQLVRLMVHHNRQVDLILPEKKTDADGYLSWDRENWTCVDGKRFIRSYFLGDRALSEFSGYNQYDLQGNFLPEEAAEVRLG